MQDNRIEKLSEGVTLYLGDCREVLPALPFMDAMVIDPPYGIREAARGNATRSKLAIARDYGDDRWDDETADDAVALAVTRAKYSIIFGGNYYDLPPSPCWLVWDKLNGSNDFADCELAWTNMRKAVRRIQFRWNGMIRQNNEPRGDHPTQKPLGVMRWTIGQLPSECLMIGDCFMGSGTTGCAAVEMGKSFVGIEREQKYFDIACRRIAESIMAPRFSFEEKRRSLPPAVGAGLFDGVLDAAA